MTISASPFELVPPGTPWPGGDGRVTAMLDIEAAELSRRLGFELASGDEPGLGPWQGLGVRLRSGTCIEFIEHRFAPVRGFVLHVDSAADPAAAVDETLASLGLGRDALL